MKKLLTILLSVFMVFSSFVSVVHADINTVADLLTTFNPDFPKTDDPSNPPIVQWTNERNCEMCIYENILSFTGNAGSLDYCSLESIEEIQVYLNENKYTASFTSFSRTGSDAEKQKQKEISVTFNTNNSVITSIDITGFEQFVEGYGVQYLLNGNYKPKTIADILPYEFPQEELKGWINPNNKSTLYLSSDGSSLLHSSHSQYFNIPITTNIFSDGSKIKASGLDYNMEFVLENYELSEIKVTGYNQKYSSTNVDGVYIAGKILKNIIPYTFPESIESAWTNDQEVRLYCYDTNSFALSSDPNFLINDKVFADIYDMTIFPVLNQQHQYELTVDNVLFKFKLGDNKRIKSIDIEGFQGENTILNGTYKAPPTIADMLPSDFPDSFHFGTPPENAWSNISENKIYIYFDVLFADAGSYCSFELTEPVTKESSNRYSYTDYKNVKIIFNLEQQELSYIEILGSNTPYVNGKYYGPASVTFNMQGHGNQIDPIPIPIGGVTISAPDTPTAEGYTFGGWYKDTACTQAWNFDKDIVINKLTLYAKWIANSVDSATIGGNVTEVTSNNPKATENVPNATVELYLGTVKVAATTTNTNGVYSFNNVENGTYNIVVTKTDGKTKTELVKINDTGDTTVDVELPLESVNSKVEHTGNEVANTKTAIKQAVVGGLDKAAISQAEYGKTITIKLQVKPMDESTAPNATKIKEKAGDIDKVEFIDMSLFKQVNSEEAQPIGNDNDVLLTIVIPFDFTNVDVDSVMILRHHGSSEKLTKNPADNQEGYKVDKDAGTITIYAKKFSSYAVAYNNVNDSPTPTPAPTPEDTPRYKVPNTGVDGTPSNNHSLLKLSSLSLLAIGAYMIIKKKKDN